MRNFKPNDAGFKELANGEEMKAVMLEIAEKGKTIAEGLSADIRSDNNDPRHEHYQDSFYADTTTVEFAGENPGPRVAGVVGNTRPYAAAVEYGYKGRSADESSDAHRVLGRTLAALDTE